MPSNPRPSSARGFSHQFRLNRQRTETEALLASQHDEEEVADSDGLYPPHCTWTSAHREPPRGADPYGNVYCLLVNRMQFIREQSFATHHQTVNLTRALLCELLAEKILRRYNEQNPGPRGLLKLANILVAGFEPFQGAPDEVYKQSIHAMHWAKRKRGGRIERKLTALEVAIISASKSFLASSACQKVVDAIYRGKLVYTPNSFIDIIPDHWKKRPISLYDPRRAPMLNQYRLIVPRTRNIIELCQFAILLALYVVVMAGRESRMRTDYSVVEAVFDVYASGWVLDQFASILEHGWGVYTQNLWSFLDVMFCLLFVVYLSLRMHALRISDGDQSVLVARTALDVLSCAAPVLVPRLAFNIMSENLLFLSLRAMMSDFMTLTILAVWCFAGFLLSLKWLHAGAHQSLTIGKWMIWIWFGLDGTGIDQSPDFHWLLGPVLMVMFAFLGNTLFLTILVSMLTNTFSGIVGNAVQEIQFRRAVLTFEGVKSDAIFAYLPPFNILALLIMLPLKWTISERMFHKINVGAVRTLNFPALLLIALYERRTLWMSDKKYKNRKIDWKNANGPKTAAGQYWAISRFTVHGDIGAVFDIDPPQSVLDRIAEEDDLQGDDSIGKALSKNLNQGFGVPGGSRRPSGVLDSNRTRSVDSNKTKQKPEESEGPANLKKEFADSSDGEDEADHPRGYRKPRRGERMDSIVDLNDDDGTNNRLLEANARLHKMEESMARMEAMMAQLLNVDAGDVSSENSEGKAELAEQLRSNSLQ
ncbi:hypothetical protein LTS03_010342 [Exophiala xenobiotica]|nr:hypothetical protein LTS03_010342 [Exophiala xenobiotica]